MFYKFKGRLDPLDLNSNFIAWLLLLGFQDLEFSCLADVLFPN